MRKPEDIDAFPPTADMQAVLGNPERLNRTPISVADTMRKVIAMRDPLYLHVRYDKGDFETSDGWILAMSPNSGKYFDTEHDARTYANAKRFMDACDLHEPHYVARFV